jgi:tRNA-2-methylthio-N6-dimethylallyladenosine synthase
MKQSNVTTNSNSRKVFIKTYGCQMNVYDSSRMEDVLQPQGYTATDNIEEAELVILNTCNIREKAAEKVYSDLGRINKIKKARSKSGGETYIAVGGCVGQAEGEEIIKRAPYVDIVMGSQSYHQLPRLLMQAKHNRANDKTGDTVDISFPEVQKFDLLPKPQATQGAAAFVSVQEGCDKFCTFCVVPYTRGAEYSRPMQVVVDEVKAFVEERGVLEVTLLGQNVNAYHGDNGKGGSGSLADLIAHLADIDGLKRIRYTTSHPKDMREDLLQAHGSIDKLMPYLHLPVQAGSDRVLKAMNRQHSAAEYMDILDRLRRLRPDIAFSGDFIVGFPTETDEDFEATMRLVESVGYASAYSFKYSKRYGTPAAELDSVVPEQVKDERLQRLQALLNAQQVQFNASTIGRECEVVLERAGKYEGQMIGRSPWMQSVHIEGAAHLQDKIAKVRLIAAHGNSVTGELIL